MCLYHFLLFVHKIFDHIHIFKWPNLSFKMFAPARILKLNFFPIILDQIYFFLNQKSFFFNRPGVAGAVLKSASSLIYYFSEPFPPNLQNIINHKPEELGSWNFERMFTPHNMSYVTCCMSCVTCHVSYVTCHMKFFLFF